MQSSLDLLAPRIIACSKCWRSLAIMFAWQALSQNYGLIYVVLDSQAKTKFQHNLHKSGYFDLNCVSFNDQK